MVKQKVYSTFEEMQKRIGKKMEVNLPRRRRVVTGTLIDTYMEGEDVCVVLLGCEETEDGKHIRYSRTRRILLFKSLCKYRFL